MDIQIKPLTLTSRIVTQGSKLAAGYDIYANEDCLIYPGQRKMIKSGIAISIPTGYYGRIAPRSGLAYKHGIDVLAGVVDAGFLDEICVILLNTNFNFVADRFTNYDHPFEVRQGDRIAQLIIEKCHSVNWVITEKLNGQDRGGGFGSTGNR